MISFKKKIKKFAVPALCLTILGAGAGVTVNAADYSCTKTVGINTANGSGSVKATTTRHTTGNSKWDTYSVGYSSVSGTKSCVSNSKELYTSDSKAQYKYTLSITLYSYAYGSGSANVDYYFNGSKVY